MPLRGWLAKHKDTFRLFFELADAFAFMVLPSVVIFEGVIAGDTTMRRGMFDALVALISSFRLWVKKSPVAKKLGVEGTSGDLPKVDPGG